MDTIAQGQGIITKIGVDDYLLTWVDAFLIDRASRGYSEGTLHFYKRCMRLLARFCDTQAIKNISQIEPKDIRQYMLWLEQTGHNKGGCHAAYRTLRTFLYWWEDEVEPEGWRNPIKKVKAPKVAIQPLEPAEISDVRAMLKTCKDDLFGARDRAILLGLIDTGARASEFLNINLDDMNQATGAILIRSGKGGKPRTVFLGKRTRKAIRKYSRMRKDNSSALWITKDGERLTYGGLRSMLRRRSAAAGVTTPAIHSFRRLFALTMLRNDVDIFSLQRLMGHSDIQVMRRYLAQDDKDSYAAHVKGAPVDNLM
jgi:site-specific recombinase XerD